MGRGPLRNFLSGVATSPVARAIGDVPSFGSQGRSLANSPGMFSGQDLSFKPVTSMATKPGFPGPTSFSFAEGPNLPEKPAGISSKMSFRPLTFQSSSSVAMEGFMGNSPVMRGMRGNWDLPIYAKWGMTGREGSGTTANLGGEWSKVDALNIPIQQAAAKYNLDPNLIKAVMKLESNGEWITSHKGAVGYMQVMPTYWSGLGYDLYDPEENIMAGAAVLRHYIDQADGDIKRGLELYHGIGHDDFSWHYEYSARILGLYDELKAAGGTFYGGTSIDGSIHNGLGGGWNIMFGGGEYPVTQEMGMTEFAKANLNGMYAYAREYGFEGHPGVDVGVPRGTQIFSPVSGTVIRAGGSGYYCDTSGCGAGKGEFKIKMENGDEVIIGHMANITVRVGQVLRAGDGIGISGTMNGDHVHIEYRTPDPSTNSGWRVIDPRSGSGVQGMVRTEATQVIPIEAFLNPAFRSRYVGSGFPSFGARGQSQFTPMEWGQIANWTE